MASPGHPEGARTYRAPSGTVVFVLSILLVLFLLGDTVVNGSIVQALLVAPWLLLGLWIGQGTSASSLPRGGRRAEGAVRAPGAHGHPRSVERGACDG